jgi:prepilin-type N-terminal cleavage/methylation domain-containing protein
MRKLRNKKLQSGFSLVELMVAMVIVAILSLTLGTMLIYIFKAWRSNSDQVELQRDATFAMDMLSREIRPSSFYLISHPTPAEHSSSVLYIGTKSFSIGGTGGNSLVCDPTSASPASGDEIELIRNRVTNLLFTNNSPKRSISIYMELEEGGENVTLNQVTISYRN